MRVLTDRMSYSIFAVLVGGILLSQAIALGLYRSDRAEAVKDAEGGQLGYCLDGLVAAIHRQPAEIQSVFTQHLAEHEIKVKLPGNRGVTLMVMPDEKEDASKPKTNVISVPPFGSYAVLPPENEPLHVARQLPDGSWLKFSAPPTGADALKEPGFLASLAGSAAVAILLSAWVLGFTTRPLRRFAAAANRLGVDMNAPSLVEAGPREVRLAAAAFNKMQKRLKAFLEDRTRMLAAVSHDLRTPLTRMRLRAEFIEDDQARERMLRDLDDMEAMISATLAFARDDAQREPLEGLHLEELVAGVAGDAREAGEPVTFTPPRQPVPVLARRRALRRALGNLIDNAVDYGQRAEVALAVDGDLVTITIDDAGPGIPESEFENVFRPFYRIEDSRCCETGGTGLGMSVANDIIRAHGGEIHLANRAEGGLRVSVVLPLQAEAQAAQ